MIRKKHFHILEAISVLLFSILANFIFGLKIDFKQHINCIFVSQLAVLSISTFIFYFMVDKLKNTIPKLKRITTTKGNPGKKQLIR